MPRVQQTSRPRPATPRTVAHLAPRRAHAKTRGAAVAGRARREENRVGVHQWLGLEPGIVMRRLRAVFAVLLAAAGLDRLERAKLHGRRVVMAAVRLLRAENKVGQR